MLPCLDFLDSKSHPVPDKDGLPFPSADGITAQQRGSFLEVCGFVRSPVSPKISPAIDSHSTTFTGQDMGVLMVKLGTNAIHLLGG